MPIPANSFVLSPKQNLVEIIISEVWNFVVNKWNLKIKNGDIGQEKNSQALHRSLPQE